MYLPFDQQFHLLFLYCQKYLHKYTKIYAEDIKKKHYL